MDKRTTRLLAALRKLAQQFDDYANTTDPYDDPLGDFEEQEIAWMLREAASIIEANDLA
jgi:hypothetical protein